MDTETIPQSKIHEGRNVRRLREMMGKKQDVLAIEIGVSQQTISKIESQEKLDEDIIEKIAKALNVPAEAIKNMSDEATINYINTFNDSAINQGHFSPYYCTFNPIDKVVELFERMLKVEQEKVALLEQILKDKK